MSKNYEAILGFHSGSEEMAMKSSVRPTIPARWRQLRGVPQVFERVSVRRWLVGGNQ